MGIESIDLLKITCIFNIGVYSHTADVLTQVPLIQIGVAEIHVLAAENPHLDEDIFAVCE